MDEVITEAIREGEESWTFVFIRHAAILNASGQPDRSLLKHYYERYLTYRPENPRALFGLADVTEKDGQTYLAMQYFKRCRQALSLTQDEIANLVPWAMARAITPRPRS
jgi:Tfp pilus assembly protein PilF